MRSSAPRRAARAGRVSPRASGSGRRSWGTWLGDLLRLACPPDRASRLAGELELQPQAREDRPPPQALRVGTVVDEAPADVLQAGDRVAVRDRRVAEQPHRAQ